MATCFLQVANLGQGRPFPQTNGVGGWSRWDQGVDTGENPVLTISWGHKYHVVEIPLEFERPGFKSRPPPPSLVVGSWTNGLASLILILSISKIGSTRPSSWVVVEIK